jgi:RHS repeat-associated protein
VAAFMWALLSLLTPSYALASISHRTTSPFPDRAEHAAQHNAIGNERDHHLTGNPRPTLREGARDVGKAAAARRWVGASPHLGMPKELIDGGGNLAWAAAHGAYGAVIATDGPGEVEVEGGFVSGGPRVESPFRLLGQVHDEDAELSWTRFRCFDADTGTWISTDPLEIAGGLALYGFDGSPSDVVDPLGLSTSGRACTPHHKGTEAAPETWKPNSIWETEYADGKRRVTYYDENGKPFSREDYGQLAHHKVTIDGLKYDLKNHPHEHQTRTIVGPKGPYQKKQVRILDEYGKPKTGWVNEK